MKKLSLSNLSRINLSRMQEQAIIGGSSDNCICPFGCSNCNCGAEDEKAAVAKFDGVMESGLESYAAEVLNSNAWSL